MLQAYREHVKERAEQGIVPKPLSAAQVADLVELIKSPPAGEEEFLKDLLANRIPAGVDEAAYVQLSHKVTSLHQLLIKKLPFNYLAPCWAVII